MTRILLLLPPSVDGRPIARDLLYGCWCSGSRAGGVTYPPVPEVLLATILSRAGHTVEVADANVAPAAWPKILARAKEFDLAVSQSSWFTLEDDARALDLLRKGNPSLRTALFGAAATFSVETALESGRIDHVIPGDPEIPLLGLADGLSEGRTLPLRIPDHHLQDMDSLPLPDRRRFLPLPPQAYTNPLPNRTPYTTVFSSRGCAGTCLFCSAPEFSGRRRRTMSPRRVLEEVRHAAKEEYRDIIFRDEHMDSPPGRLEEICRLLRGNGKREIPGWACNIRADGVDAPLLASMKAAGCHTIKVGVETGNSRLRANAGKPIPDETYLNVFREVRSLGIRAHAHFLLGLPGESAATIRETIRFARRLRPSSATFGILTPFPGVALHRKTGGMDMAPGHGALEGFHSRALPLPWTEGLNAADLERSVRMAYRSFYLHPAVWPGLLAGVLSPASLIRKIRAGAQAAVFSLSRPGKRADATRHPRR